MTGAVRALLLDADGVMQRNPDGWEQAVTACVPEADRDRFAEDLYSTEKAAMAGELTFAEVLDEVCERWGLSGQGERLRELWRRVEVADEMVELVRAVRAAGTPVHLVTNQNDDRAAYLREGLGYGELFDQLFVSCELGRTKSDAKFFDEVVEALALPPGAMLFVDDSDHHVASAREAGLRAAQWCLEDGQPALRTLLADHGVALARLPR